LARAAEIRQIAREGKRIRTAHCDVRVSASLFPSGRAGIVVPKFGRNSVERNRVKRRLCELVRRELMPHLQQIDVLIRTRPEAYAASFDALRADVHAIRQRIAAPQAGR
jgi:ribonuclease P protein component